MDLSLYVHDDNAYDHDSQNVAAVVSDTFLSAPRLRSASVLGTRLECSPLQLPWNQLVSYHSNHGYRQLADVLQMAIGMQECVISSGSKIHDVHDGPFVHHERLRTLSVPNVDVLNYLSLPSLERLTVSLRSALELSPLAAFLDAASRVRELNLIGHFAPSDRCDVRNRLKQLLHSTPFLSGLELGLSSSQATNALFSLLTESEDLLPELRFLTVHFPSFGMEDEVRALAMVASRSRNGAFAFKMRLSTRLVRDWRSLERLREFGRRNSVVECVE
ncbi:hypothetical protein V5O48_011782 [Marasmius crinis-equi]|uniref:Uncharacterized protein n=1 Tax=Marasmius crinis-equi TaxID=585013 RepID=A0ABR3F4W9_9AGAR